MQPPKMEDRELHKAIELVRSDRVIESYTSKSLEVVKTLVLNGANVNEKDRFGQTPLLLATEGLLLCGDTKSFRIHEKMISLLKDAGAYVDDQNNGTYDLTLIRTVPSGHRRYLGPYRDGIGDFKLVLGVTSYYGLTETPGIMEAVINNDVTSLLVATEDEKVTSAEMFPTKLTALHFAVWFGYVDIVKILLHAGGSPCAEDHFGLTPLVIAAAMGYASCLSVLIETVDVSIINRKISSHNVRNIRGPSPRLDYLINMPLPVCQGTTLLHEAVKSNSFECVALLLMKGAEAGAEDACGNVPLLSAGARLKIWCIEEKPKSRSGEISNGSDYGTTSAHYQTRGGRTNISSPVAINEESRAADFSGYKKIVSMLLDSGIYKDRLKKTLTSALINAVILKSEEVARLLLDKGANPNSRNENGTTAFHEAAAGGSEVLLRHFLNTARNGSGEVDKSVCISRVNVYDRNLSTPLHRAAYWGHRDCVTLLIESGANMSLVNSRKLSGLDTIILHVDRSKSFITSLMDSCVSCKPAPRWEGDYTLELDFGWIFNEDDVRQTAVLKSLLNSTVIPKEIKKDMLEHPLIESFCRIKWHRTRVFFLAVVIVHVVFVVSLSIFAALDFMNPSHEPSLSLAGQMLRFVHLIFAVLVLLHVGGTEIEFSLASITKGKYEGFILGCSALLSIVWAQAGLLQSHEFLKVATTSGWGKVMLIFMIPLAWMALMLMIGRYRAWGSRALLFGVVLKNMLLTLCVLGLIIIGFSFSFFVLFNSSEPEQFGNPWKSFVSTLVMMTGEYNYSDISSGVGVSTRILFLIFVVVGSLVVNNLVVALAVTDAQSLSTVGEWLCIRKKVEFSNAFECIAGSLASRCALPRKLTFVVCGSEEIGYRIKTRDIPKRVVNSLMELAMRKREGERPSKNVEREVIICFPETADGPVELRIKNAEESHVREILRSVRAGAARMRETVTSFHSLPGRFLRAKRGNEHFRGEV